MSNIERLGRRDQELSDYLRTVGYTCDIDELFVDFINFRAVSMSEYKHENLYDLEKELKKGGVEAVRNTCNDLGIPYWVVIYKKGPPFWQFNVIAQNKYALDFLGERWKPMSEMEFHIMHSTLRGLSESRSFPSLKDWTHPEVTRLFPSNFF